MHQSMERIGGCVEHIGLVPIVQPDMLRGHLQDVSGYYNALVYQRPTGQSYKHTVARIGDSHQFFY
jgi:hypothetical protein